MAESIDRENIVVLRWRKRIACEALGPTLDRAYPADQSEGFNKALNAIDEAENAVWGNRDPADKPTE